MVLLSLPGSRALFSLDLRSISSCGRTTCPSTCGRRPGGFQVLAVRNEAACFVQVFAWASSFNSAKRSRVDCVGEGGRWLSSGRTCSSAPWPHVLHPAGREWESPGRRRLASTRCGPCPGRQVVTGGCGLPCRRPGAPSPSPTLR